MGAGRTAAESVAGASSGSKKKRLTFWASRSSESECDYLASFFGLHFSQLLPSFAAFTQHLCSQVLPADFAFSQQDSAWATLAAAMKARAQTTATNDLIAFICFTFCLPVTQTGGWFIPLILEATQLRGSETWTN